MQKSQASIATQKKLQKLLSYTGKKEIQLEFTRQNLCKLESFEPYASFQRIDRLCKGYIIAKDIIFFLRDNAIDTSEEIDAKLLITYFDSTGEGKLLYSDYLQMLLPCDQPYLRAQASQRPTYPITQKDFLPFEVERSLAKLIQKELKLARKQEVIKQEISSRYDYDLERLFKEVDDWNYKYIDHKNLKRFLSKMGVPASEQLLIAIIRRFDLDADAKLSYSEFVGGVKPQLDYSKRQVKERIQKPSVNNREFALSPGRVPETMAINKEDTINIHHSPLRSRGGKREDNTRLPSYRRPAALAPPESARRDKSGPKKQSGKKSKRVQSRSKSKSDARMAKVTKAYSSLSANILRKEFQSFKTGLKKEEKAPQQQVTHEEKKEDQHSCDRSRDCLASPNNYASSTKDQSPLRYKNQSTTPGKSSILKTVHQQTTVNKQLFSPKSPINHRKSRQNGETSSPFPTAASELRDVRAMRSPYACERAKQEEGEASLIFLTRDAFKEILAIEGSLELAKKELALRPDFTLAGVFSKFNDNTHGRINANDMLFGLEKLGVTCDIIDAKLIVDRYDADKDGRLGFWEFSNSLLPVQPGLRDEIERKKAIWDISGETLELLKKTFRHIVDSEAMVEGIRQRLAREKNIQLRQAFDSLDWLGRGFLTKNEFKRSFENISERLGSPSLHHKIVVRIEDSIEMEALIRRFNKDKLNGRISLPEFLDELSPKYPEKPY